MQTSEYRQVEKEKAAYTLGDEIVELSINLERAETALQEVNDYFSIYDISTEEGRYSIAWEYNRHRIFVDIVSDYLFIMRKALKLLEDKERAGAKKKREEAQNGKAQS